MVRLPEGEQKKIKAMRTADPPKSYRAIQRELQVSSKTVAKYSKKKQ